MCKPVYARRVRLDRQGYEYGTGYYYGLGLPVYRLEFDDTDTLYEIRAFNRADAIRRIKTIRQTS